MEAQTDVSCSDDLSLPKPDTLTANRMVANLGGGSVVYVGNVVAIFSLFQAGAEGAVQAELRGWSGNWQGLPPVLSCQHMQVGAGECSHLIYDVIASF